MAIASDIPYTVPATPAKTFAELWVSLLVISADTTTSGRVQIETLPYNAHTGEIGPVDGLRTITTDKLFTVLSHASAVKSRAAYAAILEAIPELEKVIAAMKAEAAAIPE